MTVSSIIVIAVIILFLCFIYTESSVENYDNIEKDVNDNQNNKLNKVYKFCIMAIFKNEDAYMEEWLKHHIKEGVSHFYLYSNDEEMDKYTFLSDYKNHVTVIPWIDEVNDANGTIQKKAYTHCIRTFCNEYNYIMMLDLDEFIVSTDKTKTVESVLNDLILSSSPIKSIKVPRYDYGSSGHISKPFGGVLDNYHKREKICSSYKTIANINFVDRSRKFYGVHDFPYNTKKGRVFNANFHYPKGYPNKCQSNFVNEVNLVIKHYYVKSYDEFMARCRLWKDGGVNNFGYRRNCKKLFDERDPSRNEVED